MLQEAATIVSGADDGVRALFHDAGEATMGDVQHLEEEGVALAMDFLDQVGVDAATIAWE